ncbi:hypothetical protein [Maritalea sp.]|uniref:hypothetical protein n=1 Tax=Maritalea sp. TaxID=2003361 RepID=UPI003EF808B3
MSKDRTIPQLRRKFALLIEYGQFSDLSAIAEALGSKRKTIESWADTGADKATPGLIPTKRYPDVVQLFADAIFASSDRRMNISEVEQVLKGAVLSVEQYLQTNTDISLLELLQSEGDFSSATLFVQKHNGLDAVARKSEAKREVEHQVSTSDWFRVEFKSELRGGNVIGIQQCRTNWSFSPLLCDQKNSTVLMPGRDKKGQLDWVQETNWIGINRFVTIQTQAPWPSNLLSNFENQLPFDSAIAADISRHILAQPKQQRRIYTIEIDVKG